MSLNPTYEDLSKRVSELELLVENLQAKASVLETLHRSTPVGMGLLDGERKLRWPNDALSKITGYSLEELEGMPTRQLYRTADEYRKVAEQNNENLQTEGRSSVETEWLKKDGSTINVLLKASYKNPANPQEGLIGSALDITERKKAETALKASEEKYRLLFDCVNDAILVHQPKEDGEPRAFLEVNNTACKMYGYTKDELLTLTPAALHSNQQKIMAKTFIEKTLSQGKNTFEVIHKTRSGKTFPVEIRSYAFNWYGKQTIMSIARDISERENVKEELSQIFSMSLDMICIADINTATFLKVNPAFTEILGFSEKELLEKPFFDFIHPEDIEATRDVVEKNLKLGVKVINFENRYRCKDGGYRWLSWVSHSHPEKGVTYAIARDITEWKQNEDALKKSKALLDATGRMARVGGWELDADTLEVTWTEETYRIHEVPRDEKPPLQQAINFFHPKDRPKLSQAIQRALDHGEPYDMEIRFITAKGKHLWTRTKCVPQIIDGKIVKLNGTFQDVTERRNAEEALRESEALYRTVLGTINEGVILQSASGEIMTWNKGCENIFGISREEAIGQTSVDREWPTIREDGSKYAGQDHPSMRTLKTGSPCRNEIMGLYQPSGELRWIRINTNPLFRTDEAKPYAVVISFSDITEIKKEKDQSQMYLDATTDGIWTWNCKTNALFFSPKCYMMLGYAPDAFPADYEHWVELIHPDDRDKALATASAYLRNMPDDYENEFRLRTVDGDYRWIHTRAKLVKGDTENEGVLLVGSHEDITERKQAELDLRESEEKFRNFTEQSFVGFYIIQDGLFQYVNPKFADIFGYTVDECMDGMPFRQLVHTEDLATVQEQVRRRVAGEIDAVQYTFRGLRKTGEIIHVSIYGSTLIYQGRPAAIGTMLDITKELEMEKRVAQSQRMEAIGSLAGGIAHDFNNILFPIVGLSEMLMEDLSPDSPERENVAQIYSAGKRGSDLVRQILAFSRQSEQKRMPIRIQQILKEVMRLSRSTIPANINIKQDIRTECGLVRADPTHVHQIAMNLITNAYHAVEPKSGEISVQLKEVEIGLGQLSGSNLLPGRYALLSVSDTGTGVAPAILDKIFEPYFTTKEQGKGTGLGLAVVYGIVKEHRGDIKVFSELGKGTTFNVYLPVMEQATKTASIEGEEAFLTGHERILLVDDEEAIVKLEKQMLERLGYKVTTRVSSLEALEAFKAKPDLFDLVISDMTMPSMTGDQLAREMTAIRPETPIIICTGFSERLNQERAAANGVKGILMKPIVKQEMAKTVRKVLDEPKPENQGSASKS